MDLENAARIHAKLVFRAKHHPTKVGAALRAVIDLHPPVEVHGRVECACQAAVSWPCDNSIVIARELRVDIPVPPACPDCGGREWVSVDHGVERPCTNPLHARAAARG